MGWTDAELIAYGYIQDQFGDWIFGGREAGVPEGVAGGGGYGYPCYAYPAYQYPTPTYPTGGGGEGYTYPQSFVGREGGPYPQSFVGREGRPYQQSFVGREQRGMTPEQTRNMAARFGAVNWRI